MNETSWSPQKPEPVAAASTCNVFEDPKRLELRLVTTTESTPNPDDPVHLRLQNYYMVSPKMGVYQNRETPFLAAGWVYCSIFLLPADRMGVGLPTFQYTSSYTLRPNTQFGGLCNQSALGFGDSVPEYLGILQSPTV